MRLKEIFGHRKWPPGGHFVENLKKKLRIDLKWREMQLNVIFGHPKWPPAEFCDKISKKNKIAH